MVRIEKALSAGDVQAETLRAELAQVLQAIGMSQAAVEAVIESGNKELRLAIEVSFAALGKDFAEFGFLLAELINVALSIQETLQRQNAEHEADRKLLESLREELMIIERRTRAFPEYGPGNGQDSRIRGTLSPRRTRVTG